MLVSTIVFSQTTFKGFVYNEAKEGLSSVYIYNESSNAWTNSKEDGSFVLTIPKNVKTFQITYSYIGKKAQTITYNIATIKEPVIVVLKENTLRLNVVNIQASHKKYSEVTLRKEAIAQVQAFSLDEVLEQLPGQSVSNLELNGFKNIVFRTANIDDSIDSDAYGNKAFGTAIIVDDIPISNNENLQSYAPNSSEVFQTRYAGFLVNNNSSTNANYGVDLREIPTSTIEKIEVIQGVPSVKYGDLTSGIVKIETKAGKTPYRMSVSLRDGTTQYDFSKGFLINERIGHLNVNVNYLNSNTDPRDRLNKFNRYNFGLVWSTANRKKSLLNTLKLNYSFKEDKAETDPDDVYEKLISNDSKGISISNNLRWFVNNRLIDNISLNANFSYAEQFSHNSRIINNSSDIIPVSKESGISIPEFSPKQYRQISEIDGKPISAFFDFSMNKTFNLENGWKHRLMLGNSFRYSDNIGKGRLASPDSYNTLFSIGTNGSGSGKGFRPFNFNENVQANIQYGLYFQDNITKVWNKTILNLTAGLRYDLQNNASTLSPRFNSSLRLGKLKIRGGFGYTSKAPSLNMLYTGARYYDRILNLTPNSNDFTGIEQMPNGQLFSLLYTDVIEGNNLNLKPSKSFRSEIGFDYKFPFANLGITAYYNNLYDGFTTQTFFVPFELPTVEVDRTTIPYTYSVSGTTNTYYQSSRQINGYESNDKGIEFIMNFKKISSLGLNFSMNGSFVQTQSKSNAKEYITSTQFNNPVNSKKRWGVFDGNTTTSNLFRMGGNVSYHLPKIGLLVSLRSEHFLIDETENSGKNIYPHAYLNEDLQEVKIPESDRTNTALYGDIFRPTDDFDTKPSSANNLKKIYHNFHLRISKDFLNGFRFDFYVNNVLNLQSTYIDEDGDKNNIELTQLSFGSKISYQF
ncbi:TonB-dependent receptor plug domain-containing protein [Aureivirga marina]|uniref:TonB-dependent receptor plug domain-containing protein n=1 Tax=Aureivirga marina TaxID=1182451 RepID=UPI0018CAE369|nr:TonB-dependent receptor [Aureivirga marina]